MVLWVPYRAVPGRDDYSLLLQLFNFVGTNFVIGYSVITDTKSVKVIYLQYPQQRFGSQQWHRHLSPNCHQEFE